MKKQIYFDYAATTPMDKEVLKAMKLYFCEQFGNPGSLHSFGQKAMAAVDESREKIAKAIGADFREIIFTGSATEANNLALRGVVKNFYLLSKNQKQIVLKNIPQAQQLSFSRSENAAPRAKKIFSLEKNYSVSEKQFVFDNNKNFLPRIIISKIEHESILETCHDLEKEGVEIIYLPVNKQGIINLKKLKESLNERTILVSIMYANNEIGTIQPIVKIAEIIKNFKGDKMYPLFHTDAVQAFQFLNCNVNNLGIDLITLSAHKIYGPKGIGLLYRNLRTTNYGLQTNITGGGQEFGLRSGTENVASIVGFAKAVELAVKNREKEFKRIAELSNNFLKELKKIYPIIQLNNNYNQNQFDFGFLPNILNIYFPNQNAQDLLIKLDLNGIAVSSGSACSARTVKISHVLEVIGLTEKRIKNSLRFSFGKFTTKKEINETIKRMKKIFMTVKN